MELERLIIVSWGPTWYSFSVNEELHALLDKGFERFNKMLRDGQVRYKPEPRYIHGAFTKDELAFLDQFRKPFPYDEEDYP